MSEILKFFHVLRLHILLPAIPLIPLTVLLTSRADEDMALVGVMATSVASNYAQSNGDSASAASLLETQQRILNESANTAAVNGESSSPAPTYNSANPVQGKEGFVYSPYTQKIIDVKGIAPGTLVQDPTYSGNEKGYFRVPAPNGQAVVATNHGKASNSGITGTWSNGNGTWQLSPNGKGTTPYPPPITTAPPPPTSTGRPMIRRKPSSTSSPVPPPPAA